MILKVFCVFDSKVEAYMAPFFLRSKGEAIRAFSDMAKDNNTNVGRYPDDFSLFELGEYDDSSAKFTMLNTPYSLGVASEFVSKVSV